MSPRTARAICGLYSKRWRTRYGEEFAALLENVPPSPHAIADACLPALAWHARRAVIATALLACAAVPLFGALVHTQPTVRASHSYSLLPSKTACRAYSSVSPTGYMGSHRCLD